LAEPTPKLAEIFTNWLNLAQIGAHKPIMGRISAKLEEIRPESVAEIKLRVFDRF
jgi:hypothetical protein